MQVRTLVLLQYIIVYAENFFLAYRQLTCRGHARSLLAHKQGLTLEPGCIRVSLRFGDLFEAEVPVESQRHKDPIRKSCYW